MFYYTLGNINPKYRSKLAAIRLLAIAKRSELSECGVDAILGRLHDDLVKLYDGVKILIGNGEREIFGALVSICGDTLSQHEINLNGNKYMRDKSLVVSTVNSSNLPEFGLVRNIYVINSSLHCFELQQHDTLCYDRDYMAYKIEIPHMAQATELICADNLVDFTPYYRFTHKDMEYVPMKYYLGDVIGLHKASD